MDLMKKDLDVTTPFGPSEMEQIPKITEFQIARKKAYAWALRDCKFLIYDDTDLQNNGYDSDDEVGAEAYALKLSMGDTDEAEDSGKGKMKTSGSSQAQSHDHDQDADECSICSQCPEFPHNWKPKKFRLFKPRDALPQLELGIDNNCFHFVAVSYCWPEIKKDSQGKTIQEKRNYQVRDLDGTVRPNRALDGVIDRAVDVANSFGLRMIWIDQECLPQPTESSPQHDKDEQQIGIQAMDILYSRAMITAGFHDLELTNQAQVDAISFAMDPESRGGEHDFQPILNFLDSISQDRWYKRAWVVQESLSAGNRLVLVLRRASGISYRSHFRLAHRSFKAPNHSLDSEVRGLESQVLCISVDEFRKIVREAQRVNQSYSWQSAGSTGFDIPTMYENGALAERDREIINKAENLHSVPMQGSSLTQTFWAFHQSGIAKQNRVDALGALTLLKSRGCYYVRDLIAIMANMCGYEVRLDTEAVERQCKSLRVAFLALAIINGDFSLLAPEAYSSWGNERGHAQVIAARDSPSWLDPFDTNADASNRIVVRSFSGSRFTNHIASSNIFEFPAYIWIVEDTVDLTPVKLRWAATWARMKCTGMAFNRLENETDDEYNTRRSRQATHLQKPGLMERANYEILQNGFLDDNSEIWNGVDNKGVRIIPILMPANVERQPEMQKCIANIFFDILRCLLNQIETNPRASGVANSIWQSMRVDEVEKSDEHPPLPDEVTEALFNHPDVISRPFETLKFDKSPDGQYSQMWLFERIMSNGFLWVGRYQRSNDPETMVPNRHSDDTDNTEDSSEDSDANSHLSAESLQETQAESSSAGAAKGKGQPRSRSAPRSILERELVRQMMSIQLRPIIISQYLEGSDDESIFSINVNSITAFSLILGTQIHSFTEEQRRVQTLTSVFDVDGPCLVSTVYSSEWEILPHPDIRSMSVCWVVEKVQKHNDAKSSLSCDPSGPESRDSKGKASNSQPDSPVLAPSPSKLQELEDGILTEPMGVEHWKFLHERQKNARLTYRVVNKVRGMWEIMEIPSQRFTFA